MDLALFYLSNYIPADMELLSMLKFIAFLAAGALALGFLFKLILGDGSDLNHALSSALGILCIYAVTIVVYTFNPYELSKYLPPLPFVSFSGEYILVLPLTTAEIPLLCQQVLSMIILAFLVNLLDTFIPSGEGIFSFLFWRVLSVLISMVAHFASTWALNHFLPGFAASYAPIILLGILLVLLLLGLIKLLLGLVVGSVSPLLGAISAFFFSNIIGKQLSKAALTTAMLCGIIYLLERTGYTLICISAAALTAYIPLILVLLALWYVIGCLL